MEDYLKRLQEYDAYFREFIKDYARLEVENPSVMGSINAARIKENLTLVHARLRAQFPELSELESAVQTPQTAEQTAPHPTHNFRCWHAGALVKPSQKTPVQTTSEDNDIGYPDLYGFPAR